MLNKILILFISLLILSCDEDSTESTEVVQVTFTPTQCKITRINIENDYENYYSKYVYFDDQTLYVIPVQGNDIDTLTYKITSFNEVNVIADRFNGYHTFYKDFNVSLRTNNNGSKDSIIQFIEDEKISRIQNFDFNEQGILEYVTESELSYNSEGQLELVITSEIKNYNTNPEYILLETEQIVEYDNYNYVSTQFRSCFVDGEPIRAASKYNPTKIKRVRYWESGDSSIHNFENGIVYENGKVQSYNDASFEYDCN